MTAPSASVEHGGKIAPPRSELERQLAETWAQLLELDQIGVDQDVHALGMDSLTMTQMLSRLREQFGVDFSLKDIFDAPTVATLAARIESSERNACGRVTEFARYQAGAPQRPPVVPTTKNSMS